MPYTTLRFRILPFVALMTGAALLAGCSDRDDRVTKTTTTEQSNSTMPAPAQSSTTTTTTSHEQIRP
jgi:hypothetical protein